MGKLVLMIALMSLINSASLWQLHGVYSGITTRNLRRNLRRNHSPRRIPTFTAIFESGSRFLSKLTLFTSPHLTHAAYSLFVRRKNPHNYKIGRDRLHPTVSIDKTRHGKGVLRTQSFQRTPLVTIKSLRFSEFHWNSVNQ
jgi:hypothetical protein